MPTANTEQSLAMAPSTSRRRNARLRKWAVQGAIIAVVAGLVVWLALAVRAALAKKGVEFSFGYLFDRADISLTEGISIHWDGLKPVIEPFVSGDQNVQALVAGLFNTIKVAIWAIIFSTVIGTAIGVGRLSSNWLLRNLSFGIVEFVRNTPLLIQIVFWYFAVVLRFPPAGAAANWYGTLITSRSGIFLPAIQVAETWEWPAVIALCLAVTLLAAALHQGVRTRTGLILVAGAVAASIIAAVIGFPLQVEYPVATRFGASGGIAITPELAAILLAIVINSSAYVAEIVRGAIDALPKGQWEAAASLGLSRRDKLRDIVLPQVFRIVLPSLGNRYISLTKDTSLGIAIGFPDLFNVNGTVSNQTGRNLEGIVIVMLAYLLLSWLISAAVNIANRRLNRQGVKR